MNNSTLSHPTTATFAPQPAALDALQARFAIRVAARLTERSQGLEADVGERLRFAREKALERARASRTASASQPLGTTAAGALLLGRVGSGWWMKLASVLPALALIAGLLLIQKSQTDEQVSAAAEIDAALLSDDLPPAAYSDAGFAEFLKTPRE
ncbi:MAG: DUF3619 family protein [Burkholderiaceae bacterium]